MPPEISTEISMDESEDGLQVLAGDSHRLIQAIQKLKHLGVEDFGVSLPKICVVGDQR